MATGGPPEEFGGDQDLPNWGHESLDDRLNNLDWSGQKKANRSAEKNKKKFVMECDTRLTNDISPESSPGVGRRRTRTPHTFPHTRYVSQMSVPEQAELERLKQKINFGDMDQRSIGSDSQGRATAANNKRQPAENRKPFNFLPIQLNTNKDKESSPSPSKKESSAFSLPKDFLARDFTKDFLQNYSASLEEIGRGEPAIDSSQVVSRLVQIREYITKASTLRDDLVEKNERSANVERLSNLIDHLKAQEKSYLKFLQKMLARENEEEDVRTIDSAVGSGSVAESTSLNIDVLSEASGTTEISLSRPRIEGNLGSSASPMNVSSVDVPTSPKMKGDRRAENGRDMCPARIWVEHHGLLSKAVDPQQEAKEELKNMKKQHALLTRMLQQQEQLRALKGRQAALLALQQKAEQAIAVMDESVVTETTGSVSGLSLTSELNEELNDLIQRFHNQLHDSQTQPVPDNRRQAESLSLAREVSQSRNSSLSEPLSEDKGSIFSKLEVLLDKKKKMDSLLGELHTLQDHNLNNTAGSPQRSLDQRSTGSVASVPLTSDNRAANSPPAAAAAYPSDSVTPLNESEDEDNPDPAEKLKKLKEVRKRLNELRDLVHYYEQTSDMMTDAVNENTKDEEETEDSEYDSEQDVTHPITNIRNRHDLSSWAQMNSVTNAHSGTNNLDERQLNTECEINNRSAVNLRTFNMTSALDCLYNRENGEKEDDCDLDHDDDEDAEDDQASRVSLSSRSSIAEDAQNADFEQKFSRLIAAKQKLKQLQDLVAMYGDDTESETVAADRAVNPDQHLAEVAKPKQQPNNTSLNASKIQKDIALKEQAREKFYESKLQQQQQELKQLQEERKKLIEIQEKIKTLQAACPDLQLSTSSTGAYPTNVQIPTTSSTPDVSISSKMAAAALPDPEDSSSVDNEVWSEIRRHQILREDLRQRRKQLESLMAEHQRRQGLTETISGTSVRSDDSDTHGLHQQSRTEKTMATWGGSTQCALDEEDDEEDCLSEANQVEEEEEEQDVTFNENVSYPHRMNQSALNGKASKSGWKDPRPFSVDGNYRPSPKSRQQQNISMRRQENLRWMSELSHVEEKEHWQDQINQLKKQLEFSTNICQTLMQDQQALSYLLQNLLTNPYSVMPSNVGSPQVHLLMHQLNQCYTQLTWQQNNVQRLKQMLNDLMREQQEHLQKDRQQRNERGNNVPPPSSPNAFTPFSFLPPSMNFFNMPTFPNLCNMAPGLNFNPLFQPGFRNFPSNIISQPDTLLQPHDHNISGKTEYMAFPKPFESNSSNATEQERNPPKTDDGERRKEMWSEDKPIDQVKKHTFFDDGPSASSNSLKQSEGTRRVKQFDEESLDSLSSMPDPGDPTTRTKTFKSRKGSAQACLASKDKTPKTKNKKRKIFHQKSKVVKTTGFCTVSASSVAEPKQSKSIHAQTEETATGNIHPTNSEHLDRMIKENRSVENSSEAGSDFAMFEALRDTIYSEVATLISQNESRPHFLIELFHELQLLNTDFLRQKALFSLQDIVTRRISENSQQKDEGHKTIESAEWMASNSELTPSESLATTDDEIYEKNSDGPICREGEQNDGDNISNMSTSSNFEPFATDDLGNTVIHLDQALARMREYERMKIEAENNLDADSCNSPNSAATNLKDGPNREGAQAQLSGDDGPVVPCPRIDTQQLDRQIKAIMKEVIPFLKEHMEEVCTPYLLTSIRRMVLTLTQQNDESKEFVKFFHKQLGSILQDSLAKFSSRKLKDCGEDLLVEISEVLFNELAFFRLMQDLDNSSTVQGRCKRKSESDGALQSFSKEAQKMYEDEICSATTEVEDEDKDKDETETMKKVKETENCDPGVQSGRSDISDEEEEDASLPVSISLSKAETQALTNYGSGEDENEEEDNYEFEAGPVDVQTSLEANSEAADENEQILRETLGRTVVIERSELIAAHNTGEEHTVAQDPVSPSGVEAIPATLLLNKESESASSVTVDGKSPVASPASSGVGSPATESPVLVNEFETGSGNLSQKSDEDDFVKVEDLPLKLSMSETDPIKEMEKETENNNLCEEILNFTGEGNAAIELAGDPLLLKAPEMFGAHSA